MKYIFLLSLVFVFATSHGQHTTDDFKKFAEQYRLKKPAGKEDINGTLPKKDISKHIGSISIPDKAAIIKMSAQLKAETEKNINTITLQKLNEFIKTNDTSAVVNEAMMLFVAGAKTDIPVYLLSSIAEKTNDPKCINNLGVILKSNENYIKAFQYFSYSDRNQQAASPVIKTNMGWTAAYYGDFPAAKKYFNDALALSPTHDGALEGLCNLAYAEGDHQALMEYLLKRIKISGGGGGGNINQFVAPGLIDDILDTYENDADLKKSDPFENHLFDNGDSDDNTYNPGGAAEIIPTLPSLTAYFSYDVFGLYENMDAIKDLKNEIVRERSKEIESLKEEESILPPWKKDPYTNENGDMIFPYNYEAEHKMFGRLAIELNKRDIWLSKKMIKEELDFSKTIQAGNQLEKMMKACASDPGGNCTCTWAKANLGVVNSDYSGYFGVWSRFYKQWMENVNWYIAASSYYIKKVHHPKLNAYLNHKRESIVRTYIMSKYSTWLDDCLRVGGEVQMLHITKECANNPPKTSIASENDVIPPLKKLKKWPEPCVVPTGNFDYDDAPAGIVMTCDELRLRFGIKKKINGIKAGADLHIDFKFGENEKQDAVKIYLQGSVKAGKDKGLSVDGKNIGEAGIEAGLKGTVFIESKGGKINYGIEGGAEVTEKVGIKSEEDKMSNNDKDLAKKIDKYLPGAEVKESGSVMWTAETGPKMKWNGFKPGTENVPGNFP